MIDENFIKAAIKIRREYLKLTNNLNFYKRKAEDVISNLEDIVNKIEKIQEETENQQVTNNDAIVLQLTKLLTDIESEGRSVESLIDPLNKEIEKLGLEEQELWRNIKNKYPNLSDEEIVEYVRQRLLQENLS
jgi:predicted  nucleic acid-binding Zn-ribbon protein